MTRSALVNEATNIVENICVADPVAPSPYPGLFMVGLIDPVYEPQLVTYSLSYPAGSVVTTQEDGTIKVVAPGGSEEVFPSDAVVTNKEDGSITVSLSVMQNVLVVPGTECEIMWSYDPETGLFTPPQE